MGQDVVDIRRLPDGRQRARQQVAACSQQVRWRKVGMEAPSRSLVRQPHQHGVPYTNQGLTPDLPVVHAFRVASQIANGRGRRSAQEAAVHGPAAASLHQHVELVGEPRRYGRRVPASEAAIKAVLKVVPCAMDPHGLPITRLLFIDAVLASIVRWVKRFRVPSCGDVLLVRPDELLQDNHHIGVIPR